MRDAMRDPQDIEAGARAQVEAARATGGIYAIYVGHWVLLMGTRAHYVAHVIGTSDTTSGSILWADEAYDAEDVTANGISGAQKLGASVEIPLAITMAHVSVCGIPPWGDHKGF